MPTTRKRTTRKRIEDVSASEWALMMDEDADSFAYFLSNEGLRDLWERCRDLVLDKWVRTRPGTRPSLWWRFDAPREPAGTHPGYFYDGALPQPRKRLGGTGTPAHEVLAYVPSTRYGIPSEWKDIDHSDPPVYESEAAYLERHGLLLPGERRMLRKADFEPVKVTDADH